MFLTNFFFQTLFTIEQGWGNDFGKLLSDTVPLMIQESLIREDGGMLILPFSYIFYASVVECYNDLKQNFKIDFVSSGKNLLCTVTNSITDSDVWNQLGKKQYQENFYCNSLSDRVIRENANNDSALQNDMIFLLNNIRKSESVRFILLERREDAAGYSNDTVNLEKLKAAHHLQAKGKTKHSPSKRKRNQIEKKNEGQPTLGSSSNDTMAVYNNQNQTRKSLFENFKSYIKDYSNDNNEFRAKLADETIQQHAMAYLLDVAKKLTVERFDVITGANEYQFGRGNFVELEQFNKENWEKTYSDMHKTGSIPSKDPKSKNAGSERRDGLSIFGSNIGASPLPQLNIPKPDRDGQTTVPRINSECRPGEAGFLTLQTESMKAMVKEAARLIVRHHNDPEMRKMLKHAEDIIPLELRIHGTFITGISMVGNISEEEEGFIHPHKDNNDIVSLICSYGDEEILVGGNTVYENDKGEDVAVTIFRHNQYQTGNFESVTHRVDHWQGQRGVISFYLNKQIYKYFDEYDKTAQKYYNNCPEIYGPIVNKILEEQYRKKS